MKLENTNLKDFTYDDIKNKELVINMLKYEESFAKSEEGQNLYKDISNVPYKSLTIEKIFNRKTLLKFSFDSNEKNVEMYRTIFRTYYKSPDDYDKEVLDASYYMRENRCVYYKSKKLQIDDDIIDCELYLLDGKKTTKLFDVIDKNCDYNMICAFSLS